MQQQQPIANILFDRTRPAARAVMDELGVSAPTARKLIRSGAVDTVQIGGRWYLKAGAIERFVERGGGDHRCKAAA